jgi:hypothetical protein
VPEDKFDVFWGRVWLSMFHILGIFGVIGFVGLMLYGIFQPEGSLSSESRQEAQNAFNALVLNADRPCAKKVGSISNLGDCSILGLRPGMIAQDAIDIINSSGYFKNKEKAEDCEKAKNCDRYLAAIRDGFYVRLEFKKDSDDNEKLTELVISFNAGSHPYFDPNLLKSSFLDLLGPSDTKVGIYEIWGPSEGTSITVYVSEGKLWIIYQGAQPPPKPVISKTA